MSGRYVGQAVLRREDPRFLTGQGNYVDNIVLPGELRVVIVRSPFAHARIRSVDLSGALRVPGVVAAFSGFDLRDDWAAPLPMIWPVTPDLHVPDHWPLAVEEAKFAGDGVAVVVGETLATAKDGAEEVEVDYEPLPAATDLEGALAEGAPLVHSAFGTNRCYQVTYSRGEVERAFAGADVLVSRRFRVPRIIPSSIETRAAAARFDPVLDEFVLWTSSQIPHIVKRTLGVTVGLPEHRLHVIAPDVGGAFGAKLNVYAEEALVLTLTRRLGRPVKWVEERSEASVATTHGRDQVQRIEVAARRDGSITGIRASILASMGAYLQLETPGIPVLGKFLFGGVYGAEAYSFDCTGVFTNLTPSGAYRGVGRAEALYAIERVMDALARELGLDPAEVRRRNFLPAGEMVMNAGGIRYDSVDYDKALQRALELAEYEALRAEQSARRARGDTQQLGIGIASYVDSCGVGPSPIMALSNYEAGAWESARVRVVSSGNVEVFTGTSPQGQGHVTAWSQIAADVFGVALEDVAVFHSDSAVVPPGTGTFNSRSLVVGGTAIHLTANKVLAKARKVAAHMLEASEDDLEFAEGRFSVSGAPKHGVTLAQVARAAYLAHSLPEGVEPGLEETMLYDPTDFTYPFGTHVAVVEIDVETGLVNLVKYVAVDDCGNVVNPMIVEGQAHGGIAQGVGEALFEEALYSPDGQLETASFMSYLLPSAAELVPFEVDRTVTPSPVNPLGAKGAAESGAIAAPPAVMNAVADALHFFGVQDVDMPATPERVWAALRPARTAEQGLDPE